MTGTNGTNNATKKELTTMPTLTRNPHTNGSGQQADNSTALRIDRPLMNRMKRCGFALHDAGYTEPAQVEALGFEQLNAVPYCGGRNFKLIRHILATRNPVLMPCLFPSRDQAARHRASVEAGKARWAGTTAEDRRAMTEEWGFRDPAVNPHANGRVAGWTEPDVPAPVEVEPVYEPIPVPDYAPEPVYEPAPILEPAPAPPVIRVPANAALAMVEASRDLVAADDRVYEVETDIKAERAEYEERLAAMHASFEGRLACLQADLERAREDRAAAADLLAEVARAAA